MLVNMRKMLVVGPSFVSRAYDELDLRHSVRRMLGELVWGDHSNDGIIYAKDTLTGEIVEGWTKARGVPSFPHFVEPRTWLYPNLQLSDRARQLIEARNRAMLAEPGIRRALLFIQSNECADFIAGVRARPKPVEIIRVLA